MKRLIPYILAVAPSYISLITNHVFATMLMLIATMLLVLASCADEDSIKAETLYNMWGIHLVGILVVITYYCV
jgi:hypothetical protein